jgi:hypothetical protein
MLYDNSINYIVLSSYLTKTVGKSKANKCILLMLYGSIDELSGLLP